MTRLLILAACCLLPAVCGAASFKPQSVLERVELVKVTDGDTVQLRGADGVTRKVRLLGVDAPELKLGTAAAYDAAAYVAHALEDAATIWVEHDPAGKTDAYGRELAWVWYEPSRGAEDAAGAAPAAGPQRRLLNLDLAAGGLCQVSILSGEQFYRAELAACIQ